jgi:hypothetical protein
MRRQPADDDRFPSWNAASSARASPLIRSLAVTRRPVAFVTSAACAGRSESTESMRRRRWQRTSPPAQIRASPWTLWPLNRRLPTCALHAGGSPLLSREPASLGATAFHTVAARCRAATTFGRPSQRDPPPGVPCVSEGNPVPVGVRFGAGPRHRRQGWPQPGSTTAARALGRPPRQCRGRALTRTLNRAEGTRDYRPSRLSETEVAVTAVWAAANVVLLAAGQWPESELQPCVVDHA